MAEDAWNIRHPPGKVALAYMPDTRWRNRSDFLNGRSEVEAFLDRKWTREKEYRLIKEIWAHEGANRIAVRFAYECHDADGQWFRSYGSENWEFAEIGHMAVRHASINDVAIAEADRLFHWPQGRRPGDHPRLSPLGLQPIRPPQGDQTMKDNFEVPSMMTKEDVTLMILSAKKQAGMTWEEIAEMIDMSPVFTHSAAMGMNAFPAEKAEALVGAMGLPQEAASV